MVTWVHSELKLPDFKLRQCFFGEHLLTDKTTTKTIAIVESEKTAIIAIHFIPDFIWLATGGMNGCFNKETVDVIKGREVVLVQTLGQRISGKANFRCCNQYASKFLSAVSWKTMPPMNKRQKVLTLPTSC